MKRKITYFALSLLICMSLFSCEKDDICPSTTAKTPSAHVLFYKMDNGRAVETTIGDVKFYGLRGKMALEEISPEADLKSISLPVDFEQEQSRYLMTNSLGLTDTLTLNYSPKLTFISKACGYRFTFENTTVNSTQEHLIEAISKDIEVPPANGYLFNSKQTCAILYLIQ